jgi:hypothetical protein
MIKKTVLKAYRWGAMEARLRFGGAQSACSGARRNVEAALIRSIVLVL